MLIKEVLSVFSQLEPVDQRGSSFTISFVWMTKFLSNIFQEIVSAIVSMHFKEEGGVVFS